MGFQEMNEHKIIFIKTLTVVAGLCNFKLSDEILEIYAENLEPHGFISVSNALKSMVPSLRPGKPFPSIEEILAKLGKKTAEDQDLAREAAARIVNAISRYGWNNPTKAKEYIGSIGWDVVNMQGGWENVCDVATNENLTFLQAQWRDLAKSRLSLGKTDYLPNLVSLPDVKSRMESESFDVVKFAASLIAGGEKP
jgi:hypothetical protein